VATYNHIQTYTATGSVSSPIVMSAIPGTYDDLAIYIFARSAGGSDVNGTDIILQVNGNTGSFIQGQTGYAFASTLGADTGAYRGGTVTGQSSEATVFGFGSMYLVNYSSNLTNKQFQVTSGWASQASAYFTRAMTYGLWNQSAPITSLGFRNGYDTDFAAGTQISLYGIKRT
jgi:hypothetical protein